LKRYLPYDLLTNYKPYVTEPSDWDVLVSSCPLKKVYTPYKLSITHVSKVRSLPLYFTPYNAWNLFLCIIISPNFLSYTSSELHSISGKNFNNLFNQYMIDNHLNRTLVNTDGSTSATSAEYAYFISKLCIQLAANIRPWFCRLLQNLVQSLKLLSARFLCQWEIILLYLTHKQAFLL